MRVWIRFQETEEGCSHLIGVYASLELAQHIPDHSPVEWSNPYKSLECWSEVNDSWQRIEEFETIDSRVTVG